jgi:diguanylate cyclase (GGDEF)-like protein
MVTNVQLINNTASTLPDALLDKKPGSPAALLPAEHLNLRLHLTSVLQTTLDLGKILQLFFDTLQHRLPIDSLHYSNDTLNSNIKIGRSSRHQCNYTLVTQQENLGVLSFSRGMRFNEQDLELLETLINCLIFPVRNALLYREIALSFRNELPLSILVVDIDMFKSINDRFGHSAGDCVLKNVVKLLGQDCRETDSTYRAYRFGGEEFVLILNNTDRAGATIVAERIRQHIEITSTSYQQQDIQATVSVGVSTLREGDNLSTLFSRADKALYQAKHNGRNQVVDWQEMAT